MGQLKINPISLHITALTQTTLSRLTILQEVYTAVVKSLDVAGTWFNEMLTRSSIIHDVQIILQVMGSMVSGFEYIAALIAGGLRMN